MPFDVPRWWWMGLCGGLALIALGGTMHAVEAGMWDNYRTDGCGDRWYRSDDAPAEVDCRGQRTAIGIVDAVGRATFGPGIAVAVLAAVYVLAAAIVSRRGDEEPPRPPPPPPATGVPP